MTHDRQRRRWLLGSLLCAATIFAAACASLPPATPTDADISDAGSVVTVTTDDRTDISVEENAGQIVLDVQSDSGIGSADVSGLSDEAGQILLRLHVSGLEQFRFLYDSTEIEASVSSSGNPVVMQSVSHLGGESQAIDEESPYWLTIELVAGTGETPASIPLENGYFQVTPPIDFADAQPAAFTFSWIDFYR